MITRIFDLVYGFYNSLIDFSRMQKDHLSVIKSTDFVVTLL